MYLGKSFERKNLSYVVLHEEGKLNKLLDILKNVKGSSIVYVRSRRKTKEVGDFLRQNKVSADHYHAGLKAEERSEKQDSWVKGDTRVMVSTNAFGMGIDKPNVRSVIHLDLPDSLEAYYQEAGRAGRDEKKAYAVLLYNYSDKLEVKKRMEDAHPDPAVVKEVYRALGGHFQLAIGAGLGQSYDFDLQEFSDKYNIRPLWVFNALKILERQGLITLTEQIHQSARVRIVASREDLYKYEVENPRFEGLIKFMLRSYGGVLEYYVNIREKELSVRLAMELRQVKQTLAHLHKEGIIDYEPLKDKPQIIFKTDRQNPGNVSTWTWNR